MSINDIITCFMAFGAAIGGIDRMFGNKLGYGEKFENGFKMLGPVGLSMAGIICLAPVLSNYMGMIVGPISRFLHMDPSIWGSVLSIDMGGYLMSTQLAEDPMIGLYAGVIVAAIFGCTVVFSIPVGLSIITMEDRPYFMKGILLGFIAMPFAIVIGGIMLGLPIGVILWNSFPVLLLSVFLAVGVVKKPELMMKGFQKFAAFIRAIATFGLTVAAITHMTGIEIIKSLPPLQNAMQTVTSICIVLLGSMPLAELIQRILKKPLEWVRRCTGFNAATTTGMLLSMVSVTPAFTMIPQMNKKGKVVCASFLVCCGCTFGAHTAFMMSTQPDLLGALLVSKVIGGVLGIVVAMAATKDMAE